MKAQKRYLEWLGSVFLPLLAWTCLVGQTFAAGMPCCCLKSALSFAQESAGKPAGSDTCCTHCHETGEQAQTESSPVPASCECLDSAPDLLLAESIDGSLVKPQWNADLTVMASFSLTRDEAAQTRVEVYDFDRRHAPPRYRLHRQLAVWLN